MYETDISHCDTGTPASLPTFHKFLSAEAIAICLDGYETNVTSFYSIWQTLESTLALFEPQLEPLASSVLPAVESDLGQPLHAAELAETFR